MKTVDDTQIALSRVIFAAPKEKKVPETWEEARPLMMYVMNASRVNAQGAFNLGNAIRMQSRFFLALCLFLACLAFLGGRYSARVIARPPQPVKVSMAPSCPAGRCDSAPAATPPRPWPIVDGSIVVD